MGKSSRRKKRGGIAPAKAEPKTIIEGGVEHSTAHISFSFQHMDLNSKTCNAMFHPSRCKDGYLLKFLQRAQGYSQMTASEMLASRSSSLRCHPIDFHKSSVVQGWSHLPQQHLMATPYQLTISANRHGRIHGFFLNNVFHVVWIDPDHKLFPSDKP